MLFRTKAVLKFTAGNGFLTYCQCKTRMHRLVAVGRVLNAFEALNARCLSTGVPPVTPDATKSDSPTVDPHVQSLLKTLESVKQSVENSAISAGLQNLGAKQGNDSRSDDRKDSRNPYHIERPQHAWLSHRLHQRKFARPPLEDNPSPVAQSTNLPSVESFPWDRMQKRKLGAIEKREPVMDASVDDGRGSVQPKSTRAIEEKQPNVAEPTAMASPRRNSFPVNEYVIPRKEKADQSKFSAHNSNFSVAKVDKNDYAREGSRLTPAETPLNTKKLSGGLGTSPDVNNSSSSRIESTHPSPNDRTRRTFPINNIFGSKRVLDSSMSSSIDDPSNSESSPFQKAGATARQERTVDREDFSHSTRTETISQLRTPGHFRIKTTFISAKQGTGGESSKWTPSTLPEVVAEKGPVAANATHRNGGATTSLEDRTRGNTPLVRRSHHAKDSVAHAMGKTDVLESLLSSVEKLTKSSSSSGTESSLVRNDDPSVERTDAAFPIGRIRRNVQGSLVQAKQNSSASVPSSPMNVSVSEHLAVPEYAKKRDVNTARQETSSSKVIEFTPLQELFYSSSSGRDQHLVRHRLLESVGGSYSRHLPPALNTVSDDLTPSQQVQLVLARRRDIGLQRQKKVVKFVAEASAGTRRKDLQK